jgi:SAM-dependent methyltransferase
MTQDRTTDLPIPPRELVERTGPRYENQSDEWFLDYYERTGRARRRGIEQALPADFSFTGMRVLDFGCGAGRVLRQFASEAESGEFWGCDLYEPTVAWLEENLSPPFRFYVSAERPLPHPDGYFDLVYAISVFTHITGDWAEWLLELRRILKPDGLLLATFIGPLSWERSLGSSVAEDELGMAALRLGQSYADTSGPLVLHSPWWLRAHWGRAFDVVTLWPHGFAWRRRRGQRQEDLDWRLVAAAPGHGVFVGRKRPGALTPDGLIEPVAGDPREEAARRQQDAIAEAERKRAPRRWRRASSG